VIIFLVASVLCFASIPRALTIEHTTTREGFVGILVTCGLWAGGYVGYFMAPGEALKTGMYLFGLISALACVAAWLYFASAYTGRSPRKTPYLKSIIAVFAFIVLLKLTNPLHNLYFTTEWVTQPFPHLAIQHGTLHWVILGASYVAIGISFFMLIERFYHAGADTKPLVGLVAITALPIGLNILSITESSLFPLWYEPIGVAVFAVGTLFVYFRRFEIIQFAGESEQPAIFLDQDNCIRDYNRAATTLFPELQDSIGRPIEDVLPTVNTGLKEGDGLLTVEHDTKTRFYQLGASPFLSGEVQTGQLVSITDVSERERYRQQLETKTEKLESLNRLVRHDIRNDMTVILGWGEELYKHVDEEGEGILDRILRKSNHIVGLTEVARDIVESLSTTDQPSLQPIEVREYLEIEIKTARESYPDAQFHVPEDIPSVSVQANEMLSSVFQNLLNNTVQHNDKETPEITVTAEEDKETVQLRIADNGPGIPDDRKETVFGKGEKGLDSPGTGIGLYLVQSLVESYGGEVWIEDAEQGGALFVVELMKDENGSGSG